MPTRSRFEVSAGSSRLDWGRSRPAFRSAVGACVTAGGLVSGGHVGALRGLAPVTRARAHPGRGAVATTAERPAPRAGASLVSSLSGAGAGGHSTVTEPPGDARSSKCSTRTALCRTSGDLRVSFCGLWVGLADVESREM